MTRDDWHLTAESQRAAYLATALGAVAATARSGQAEYALVRGGAGSGRSTVLRAVHESALAVGSTVLEAAGRSTPPPPAYTALRGLLTPVGVSLPDHAGHSRHHMSDLAYQSLAELAGTGSVAVLVDDAHLCDEESLRSLEYVLRRGSGLRLLVILTYHHSEPGPGRRVLRDLVVRRPQNVIVLPPLSTGEIAECVGHVLGEAPDSGFVVRCAELTEGNPRLLRDVLRVARERGIRPLAEEVRRLGAVTCDVRSALDVERLARHGVTVFRTARAVAVLESVDAGARGHATACELVSVLARIPRTATEDALRTLKREVGSEEGGDLISPGLRSRLLDGLSPVELRELRDRAARLLNDAGYRAEGIAQLLPGGAHMTWMCDILREAATAAARRNAPAATRFLDQLIRSGAPSPGSDAVLRDRMELAGLLERADPAAALGQLRWPLRHTTDLQLRALTAVRFCALAAGTPHLGEAAAHLDEVLRTLTSMPGQPYGSPRRTVHTQVLCARLAAAFLEAGDQAEPWRTVPPELPAAVAFHLADRPEEARSLLWDAGRRAASCGNPSAEILALSVQSLISHVVGDVAAASWAAHSALAVMARTPQAAGLLLPYIAYVQALSALSRVRHASDAVEDAGPAPSPHDIRQARKSLYDQYFAGAVSRFPDSPVHFRTGTGRLPEDSGADPLTDLGNPIFTRWRLSVDQALVPLGVAGPTGVSPAHGQWSAARAIGFGLLAGSFLVTMDDRRPLAELKAASQSQGNTTGRRLEEAWAAYRLGSALLRHGHTAAAGEQLVRAGALADGCDAHVLGVMARTELAAVEGPGRSRTRAASRDERGAATPTSRARPTGTATIRRPTPS
ncbi:ATP-binding protein [Streptomyces sp. MA5143a]|uniref:ATP-binding protein n=1 Tax=Streptomyces sp. MA5143a TaxID=2083010 RepID=UPI000D28C653|nr:ATP-binding protein [Streptomyces sp. MA5143a]SPF07035.1 putative ATPase [Streptomyces sp. MA5143a]